MNRERGMAAALNSSILLKVYGYHTWDMTWRNFFPSLLLHTFWVAVGSNLDIDKKFYGTKLIAHLFSLPFLSHFHPIGYLNRSFLLFLLPLKSWASCKLSFVSFCICSILYKYAQFEHALCQLQATLSTPVCNYFYACLAFGLLDKF